MQLVEALRCEGELSGRGRVGSGPWSKTAGAVESSRTAALHGEELLARARARPGALGVFE